MPAEVLFIGSYWRLRPLQMSALQQETLSKCVRKATITFSHIHAPTPARLGLSCASICYLLTQSAYMKTPPIYLYVQITALADVLTRLVY